MYKPSIEMMKVLIAYGIDVNLRNKRGMNMLMYEVQINKSVEKIQLLIQSGANIYLKDKKKTTILMMAVTSGNMDIITLFDNVNINDKNKNGYTAFMRALRQNRIDIMEWLYSKGACINTVNKKGKTHLTPLIIAIKKQHIESVAWLLQHCSNVNKKSLLKYAVSRDNVDIIKLLLDYGADIKNALNHAVSNNKYENIKILLEYDFLPQTRYDAIIVAITKGYMDIIQLLYDDFLLETKDNDGNTPLLLAVKSSRFPIQFTYVAKFLLEKGANVHVLNNGGENAFYWACYNMDKNMIELLMYYGCIDHGVVPEYFGMHKILVKYMNDDELYNIKDEEAKYAIKELSNRRIIQKKKVQYYERVLKYIPEHNAAIRYKIGNMGYNITKFDFDKEITQDILKYLDATPLNIQSKVNEYLYEH